MPAALVTGSAKGIGKALALALAGAGFDVAVHYRGSREEAEAVAQEVGSKGVRGIALQADVTKQADAEGLVRRAHAHFGRLDVLINNVGNYHKGPLSELSADTWHAMLDSNLNATFYTCQTAALLMRAAGGGRIINIGFAGAEKLVARPGIVAYSVAKTGVILYSKALAKVEAKHNITVNIISPGVMENSVTQPLEDIPMRRAGRLEELTHAALYLVSPGAAYVTGVHLEVAGGWNL